MSWLDDMEAADPAYPDPDADPWGSPGYVPGTSHQIAASGGVVEAIQARLATHEAFRPHHIAGRGWVQIRGAEASARAAGLRASMPEPGGRGLPEYEADAAAWGSGLGVAPDGPEAGE